MVVAADLPAVLTGPEVAAFLRLNPKTFYAHANAGRFPFACRVGRKWIAHRDSVLAWLRAEHPHRQE